MDQGKMKSEFADQDDDDGGDELEQHPGKTLPKDDVSLADGGRKKAFEDGLVVILNRGWELPELFPSCRRPHAREDGNGRRTYRRCADS